MRLINLVSFMQWLDPSSSRQAVNFHTLFNITISCIFLPLITPDRRIIKAKHHALMDIERPAVITGQPVHVTRVGDDQRIDTAVLHCCAGSGNTPVKLSKGEMQCWCGHVFSPYQAQVKLRMISAARAVSPGRVARRI